MPTPMVPLRRTSTLLYDPLKGSSVKGLKGFHPSDPFPLWPVLVDFEPEVCQYDMHYKSVNLETTKQNTTII